MNKYALGSQLNQSDEELVASACRGDRTGFRLLYERHYRMAVALAHSRLHDIHLAEDAAQEAFVIARNQLKTLNNGQRFPQWLGTITRRTAIAILRAQPERSALNSEPIAKEETCFDNDQYGIRDAISQLSESQQEVIYLRYFSNLSYEDIAAALDTTPQGVHGRLQRARKSLEKQFRKSTNG